MRASSKHRDRFVGGLFVIALAALTVEWFFDRGDGFNVMLFVVALLALLQAGQLSVDWGRDRELDAQDEARLQQWLKEHPGEST